MTLDIPASDSIHMSLANDIPFDEAALETLFRDHFKPLCAYCQFRFGFDLNEAKEAVHTGFIRLWENRETISAQFSAKAYLYKIVSNVSLDMLRHEQVKQKHVKFVSQNQSYHGAAEGFHASELKQLSGDIDKAIAELPEQMRKIFELSRYEGLKYTEIASRLNLSVKTVETQMSRALVKLRQKLAHYLIALTLIILVSL
jgi:RNA polymerase sigma-70 factor (ECF subfamily)